MILLHVTSGGFPLATSKWMLMWLVPIFIPLTQTAQPTLPDQLYFERIQTEDGLSHTYINALAQDSTGYLWFGTQEGLVKYDGYSFTTYRHDPNDSSSIDNNRIESLYVTRDGSLWIGTSSGLNRCRPGSSRFERFIYDPDKPSGMAPGQVNDMTEDANGRLWLATQSGGLVRFDLDENRFERFLADSTAPEHLLSDQVRTLMFDRKGFLWIGTGETFNPGILGGGLLRFNPLTGEVRRFRHRPDDPSSLLDDRVSALMEDRNGHLWIGTGQAGLHRYNPKTESFILFQANPSDPHQLHAPQTSQIPWSATPHVRFLHEDQRGWIWIGTFGGGVHLYDPNSHQLRKFSHDPLDSGSLNDNLVWSFLEDYQGRIWIGNLIGGLHKVDPASRKFHSYQHKPGDPHSLTNNGIMGLCLSNSDSNTLWVTTRTQGLNKLDLSSGRITRFRNRPKDPNSLADDGLWSAYEDRSGALWVGTQKGLDRLDPGSKEFRHYRHDPDDSNSLSGQSVTRIFEDSHGIFWIGTWGSGLNRWDRSRKQFTRYSFFRGGHISYENSIFVIHEDRRGKLWTATWLGGLYRFDNENDRFQEIPALRNIGANYLYEDQEGQFWIGTNDHGLICFDPATDSILKTYTISDGLPSNALYGILPARNKGLWLSTNKGICRLDPHAGQVKNYDLSDGLPSNTFNYQGACKTPDGTYFFSSNNGLVYFSGRVAENTYPPKPHITKVRMLSRSGGLKEEIYHVRPDEDEKDGRLALPYSRRDLVFEYLCLHYTNPAKNQYRYKLEPYDADWINAGTQRNARYTNLSPGRYTFRMQAANSDGYWSRSTASLSFIIQAPWWRTLPAYALYMAVIGGLLWVIYRILIDRERQRNEIHLRASEAAQLREVDQMKSRFFANISHEFRTPLTLIQGPVQALLEENTSLNPKAQYRLILRNTERLRRLIDQLLDLSRLESGRDTLQLKPVDLVQFFRVNCSTYEVLATSKQIRLAFRSQSTELPVKIDTEKMEKVCFNLLSNAFKFTPAGGIVRVDLSAASAPDQEIKIQVQDSGIGIDADALPHIFDRFYQAESSQVRTYEGSGIGLALVKEYVELHGGRVEVQSTKGRGATFQVFLPGRLKTTAGIRTKNNLPSQETSVTEEGTLDYRQALPSSSDHSHPIVLLVEDNADMQLFLRESIQENYEVLQAENGRIGMNLALEYIPDLIVSDVMMPVMDGFTLCRVLREDPRTCHIPIVLLTARAEATDRLQGIECGAEAYLTKPFDKAELNLRIRKLIEQRSILQQKFKNEWSLKPANVTVTSLDEKFLSDLLAIIEEKLDDPSLSLESLGKSLGMSRSQLHRKLKALTGESPGDFLRRFRLQRAAQLLRESQLNISEICYEVGFSTHAHFTKMFGEHFGCTPSEYRRKENDKSSFLS